MDTAATITVRIRFPSHTKRRGARADFGRLFKSTRNGSKIWAAKGLDQRKRAVKRLIRVHKRKLKRVSVKVTPVWRKRLLSRSMFHRQKRIWEGELKIKRLIRPREAVSSQRDKNRIRDHYTADPDLAGLQKEAGFIFLLSGHLLSAPSIKY